MILLQLKIILKQILIQRLEITLIAQWLLINFYEIVYHYEYPFPTYRYSHHFSFNKMKRG